MKLENKVAIVTGAGRGIGKAIALNLAQEGIHLALVARTEKEIASTAFACEQYGVTAKYYPFDLTAVEKIPELIKQIHNDFKRIHILINDAGKYETVEATSKDHLSSWDEVLDLNFKAVYHLTQEVLPMMRLNEEGAIISISSIAGLIPSKGGEIYNSSKAALKSYSGCLYEDVREFGIKVVTIYPGLVNTAMNSGDKYDDAKMIQPEDIASAVNWSLKLSNNACPAEITIRPQRSPVHSQAAA